MDFLLTVLISQQLDLEMSGVFHHFHDEYRRGWDLNLYLSELVWELHSIEDLPDSLPTAALASLDHDGVPDLLRLFHTLLNTVDTALPEQFSPRAEAGHVNFSVSARPCYQITARPGQGWNLPVWKLNF